MGQKSTKVEVTRNATSPSDGGKCCITGPLDGFVNYDDLWHELVDLLRNPSGVQGVHKPTMEQASETEFTISKTLNLKEFDVGAMHKLGLHRLLLDNSMLEKWTAEDTRFVERYKIDKAKGRICAERLGPLGELVERSFTMLHRNPLRVEFYIEVPGFRRCGVVVETAMRFKLLNPAIRRVFGEESYEWQMFKGRGEHKDFLKSESESVCQPGRFSVVSDPLDDITDFDTLWYATVDILRYPEPHPEKDWEVVEVDQISDTEFHVRRNLKPDHPKVEKFKPESTWDRVMLDKAKGTIVADTLTSSGQLQVTTWYVINRNPVRAECWCEGPPARKTGPFVKMRLLQMVDVVLERSQCAEGISRALADYAEDPERFEDAEEGGEDNGEDEADAEAALAQRLAPREDATLQPGDRLPGGALLDAWRSKRLEFEKVKTENDQKTREAFEKAKEELTQRVRQSQADIRAAILQRGEDSGQQSAASGSQGPSEGRGRAPGEDFHECQD